MFDVLFFLTVFNMFDKMQMDVESLKGSRQGRPAHWSRSGCVCTWMSELCTGGVRAMRAPGSLGLALPGRPAPGGGGRAGECFDLCSLLCYDVLECIGVGAGTYRPPLCREAAADRLHHEPPPLYRPLAKISSGNISSGNISSEKSGNLPRGKMEGRRPKI